LVGAKAKKFSPHTGGALMRGAPDSAPQSLILPSPPIRFKAGRFSASKSAVVFRPERFGFSCGVVDCVDFFTELLEETTQFGQIALRPLSDLYGCYCLNLARATTIRRLFDLLKAEDGRIEQLANSFSAYDKF
jgi:hypothetical protein